MKFTYLSLLISAVALVGCGGGGGGGNEANAIVSSLVPKGCESTTMSRFTLGETNTVTITEIVFTQATDTQLQLGRFTASYQRGEEEAITVRGDWHTSTGNDSAIHITQAIDDNKKFEISYARLVATSVETDSATKLPTKAHCNFTGGQLRIGTETDANTYPLSGAVDLTYTPKPNTGN